MVHWKIVVKTCTIILMIAYGLRTHIFDTHFLSYKENNEIRTLFINKIINFSLFYAWQCINKHADIQEELMESWCLLSHDILFKLLNYRVNVWIDYYYINKVSCHELSSNSFIAKYRYRWSGNSSWCTDYIIDKHSRENSIVQWNHVSNIKGEWLALWWTIKM